METYGMQLRALTYYIVHLTVTTISTWKVAQDE